jgi:peptidoglycan hydrolase-like protein with peptidoglycan-binding domain
MVKNLVILVTVVTLFAGSSRGGTDTVKHSSATSKSSHHKISRHSRSRKGAWKHHGQQKIDGTRATQIQQALIREKYLDGQATGAWDARTEAAMARFQADNGWQSKITPDSRALIKLGLGPDHQGDLQNLNVRAAPDSLASSGSSSNGAAKPR